MSGQGLNAAKDKKAVKKGGEVKKETSYILNFSAVACPFSIKVNDMPVLELNLKGQISSIIPINNTILRSGDQELSVTINPLKGEKIPSNDASLKVYVTTSDEYRTSEEKHSAEVDFGIDQKTGTNIKDKTLPYTKKLKFKAEVPYSINILDDAVNLSGNPNVKELLMKTYKELLAMIENKEYDKIRLFFEPSESIIAKMLYLGEKEKKERIDGVIEDFSKNNFKAIPLSDDVVVKFYGFGKLARLENKDGSNALAFKNEKATFMTLDFLFYLPKSDTSKMKVF